MASWSSTERWKHALECLPILTLVISIEPYHFAGDMAYSVQRQGGVASSSRPVNGFKGAATSVEFLGREMLGMQLRDAKPDADDERVCFCYCLIGMSLKLVLMFWSLDHHTQSKYMYKSSLFPPVRFCIAYWCMLKYVSSNTAHFQCDVCTGKALLCVIASWPYHWYCDAYCRETKHVTTFMYWKVTSSFLQDMGSSSDVTDGSSNEAGHIIATTIHGRNGLPKQVTIVLLWFLIYIIVWCWKLSNKSWYVLWNSRSHTSLNMLLELVLLELFIR